MQVHVTGAGERELRHPNLRVVTNNKSSAERVRLRFATRTFDMYTA